MQWKSGVFCVLFVVIGVLLINTSPVEGRKKQKKFDGDFEFADEVSNCKIYKCIL